MPAAIVGRAAIKPRVRTDPALSPRPERSRHQIAGAAPACEATRSCILDKARRSVESTDVGASVGRWRPYVLSILRIVVALLFLQHGLSKFFGFPAPDHGRPLVMLLREGQMSDYKGAALMPPAMPTAKQLLADKGHDADWFRAALAKRRIAACIPSKSNRKTAARSTSFASISTTRRKLSIRSSMGSRAPLPSARDPGCSKRQSIPGA